MARTFTLTKGPFIGKELIFETDGETVKVICQKCGWFGYQTFFIKDFTEKDLYRDCDECGSSDLKIIRR